MITTPLKPVAEMLLLLSCLALSAREPVRVRTAQDDEDAPAVVATEPDNDQVTVILAPRHQAVLSAETAGRVVTVRKELGEPFEAGEVLVDLDDTVYQANARMAAARLASCRENLARVQKLIDDRTRERHAEAVLAAAKANLAATQRLFDSDHASHLDIENARRDTVVAETNCELVASTSQEALTNARRELEVAAGEHEITQDHLRACALRGPWAGRVSRVRVNAHELVQRGTPVVEVLDDRVLRARFLLASSAFRSVHVGQELTLHLDEVHSTVTMRVSHIAAALDAASGTFEVHGEVDNAEGRLRAGLSGWLRLSEMGEH